MALFNNSFNQSSTSTVVPENRDDSDTVSLHELETANILLHVTPTEQSGHSPSSSLRSLASLTGSHDETVIPAPISSQKPPVEHFNVSIEEEANSKSYCRSRTLPDIAEHTEGIMNEVSTNEVGIDVPEMIITASKSLFQLEGRHKNFDVGENQILTDKEVNVSKLVTPSIQIRVLERRHNIPLTPTRHFLSSTFSPFNDVTKVNVVHSTKTSLSTGSITLIEEDTYNRYYKTEAAPIV